MNQQLEKLLNRWLDGELLPPEEAALQRMLVEDPEARQVYYELLMVDRMLDETVRGPTFIRGTHEAIEDEVAQGHHSRNFHARYLAIAAVAALSLFAMFFFSKKVSTGPSWPLITGSSDSRITIAQREESSHWNVGELLRLDRGAASIQLNSLVSANFDGPTAVELTDRSGDIRLLEGIASFHAEADDNHFELQIPGGVIQDIRAGFSVEVLSKGVTNIRVDSGFLTIKPRGEAQPIHLRAGDALRFETDGKSLPIPLTDQVIRSSLPGEIVLFQDDFIKGDGQLLNQRSPQVGQAWKVLEEEHPTIIRNHVLDTSYGHRRILAPLAAHDSTGSRTVYVFTFHLLHPSNMGNKVMDKNGIESISLVDESGKAFLSIYATTASTHRWQLRDVRSDVSTTLTPVCALWNHALTLCYDLGGRVTLHDGATAQSPIIAEMRIAAPLPVGGILVENSLGGDLAFSSIEAALIPAATIKSR